MPRGPPRGAGRSGDERGARGSGTTSGSGSPLGSVTTGWRGGRGRPSSLIGGGGGGSSAESQLTDGPSMRMRSGSRCVSTRARSTSGGEPISATSVSA